MNNVCTAIQNKGFHRLGITLLPVYMYLKNRVSEDLIYCDIKERCEKCLFVCLFFKLRFVLIFLCNSAFIYLLYKLILLFVSCFVFRLGLDTVSG